MPNRQSLCTKQNSDETETFFDAGDGGKRFTYGRHSERSGAK